MRTRRVATCPRSWMGPSSGSTGRSCAGSGWSATPWSAGRSSRCSAPRAGCSSRSTPRRCCDRRRDPRDRAGGGGAAGPHLPVLIDAVARARRRRRAALVRTTFFDATERTAYERELLEARRGEQAARERMALLADVGRGLDEVRTLAQRAQRLADCSSRSGERSVGRPRRRAHRGARGVTAVRDPTLSSRCSARAAASRFHAEPQSTATSHCSRSARATVSRRARYGRRPARRSRTTAAFLADLAARAATALENARLYDHERSVAHALQHSLLAIDLPDDPRLGAGAALPLRRRLARGRRRLRTTRSSSRPGASGSASGTSSRAGWRRRPTMGQLRSALRALAAADSARWRPDASRRVRRAGAARRGWRPSPTPSSTSTTARMRYAARAPAARARRSWTATPSC